jgi:hypothetical protein
MNGLDEKLDAAYDWLDNLKGKILDWHLLLFVMGNSIIVSIMTTGYLGDGSIKLNSPAGSWYLFSFAMLMLMAAFQVRLKAVFLYKIFTAGILTFLVTWNVLALIEKSPGFTPWVSSYVGQAVVYIGTIVAINWCFTGNHDIRQQVSISQSDYAEFLRLKNANVIPMDQASEG